jgi:hypothetical protein
VANTSEASLGDTASHFATRAANITVHAQGIATKQK